jgi:hypothetical protein
LSRKNSINPMTRRGFEKGSNSIFISIAAPPVGAFKGDGKEF